MPTDPDTGANIFHVIGAGVGSFLTGALSILGIKASRDRKDERDVIDVVKEEGSAVRAVLHKHAQDQAIADLNLANAMGRLSESQERLATSQAEIVRTQASVAGSMRELERDIEDLKKANGVS